MRIFEGGGEKWVMGRQDEYDALSSASKNAVQRDEKLEIKGGRPYLPLWPWHSIRHPHHHSLCFSRKDFEWGIILQSKLEPIIHQHKARHRFSLWLHASSWLPRLTLKIFKNPKRFKIKLIVWIVIETTTEETPSSPKNGRGVDSVRKTQTGLHFWEWKSA